jgi:hypothetical protein
MPEIIIMHCSLFFRWKSLARFDIPERDPAALPQKVLCQFQVSLTRLGPRSASPQTSTYKRGLHHDTINKLELATRAVASIL